jgi:hypothetical protein
LLSPERSNGTTVARVSAGTVQVHSVEN